MPSFPDVTLQTDGPLTISELVESDASSLLKAVNDRDLRRWLPLPSPYTEDMAVQWCTSISRDMRETGRGFVLGIRDGGGLVGSIDAKRVDWRAMTAELSYWTASEHRGRGIMPTSVRRVARWMLTDLGFERIELRIAPENLASRRAAEKAGFHYEGTARNAGFTDSGRVDLAMFSLVTADLGAE